MSKRFIIFIGIIIFIVVSMVGLFTYLIFLKTTSKEVATEFIIADKYEEENYESSGNDSCGYIKTSYWLKVKLPNNHLYSVSVDYDIYSGINLGDTELFTVYYKGKGNKITFIDYGAKPEKVHGF